MQIIKEVFSNLSSWGHHPVLIEPRNQGSSLTLSADQVLCKIGELSRTLGDWGIKEKKPVLLILENSVDFVVAFLALLNVKAVPVPVKPEYRHMELEEIFQNTRPQAVVCESSLQPLVEELCDRSTIIARDGGEFILKKPALQVYPPVDLGKDTFSINYTYRGYGYPLGALLPEQQYIHGARVVQDELAGRPGDVMMILLPLTHIFPMVCGLFLCLLYRITALVVRTLHPRLIFEYIDRYRVNYMTAVPEIYELLWKCRSMAFDISSLQLLFSGGSCLSDELYHNIHKDFGVYIAHGYGLTEFTPISRNSANHNRVGTVGPICNGVRVRIDQPSADGFGEILFKTEGMARGYLQRPAETKSAYVDGWFRTGDIGRIDKGHLVFLRERKNTRKVNGNMVDLEEIRRALSRSGGITRCSVEVQDGILRAEIELEGNRDFRKEIPRIRQFLEQNLSSYKIPRRFGQLT
jgi:long-subunit acyl-CoA synthetase (AMP-forming)